MHPRPMAGSIISVSANFLYCICIFYKAQDTPGTLYDCLNSRYFQRKNFVTLKPYLARQRRVGTERLSKGWYHFLQFLLPLLLIEFLRKATLQEIKHNRHGR